MWKHTRMLLVFKLSELWLIVEGSGEDFITMKIVASTLSVIV